MNRSLSIFKAKLAATFGVLVHIPYLLCCQRKAYGDKKSALTIIIELMIMIHRDYGYLTAQKWGSKKFIHDYFVERIYLRSSSVNEYVSELVAILIMIISSSAALKRMQLLDNKNSFWDFCNSKGLPVTKRLGNILKQGNGSLVWVDAKGAEQSIQELLHQHLAVFVKTAEGTQGASCAKWELLDDMHVAVNHVATGWEELSDWVTGELLVEEIVPQHKAIAAFHSKSLNTLRMVTMRKPDGSIELNHSFLRLGVGEQGVDNFNHGGIGVLIRKDGTLAKIGRYKDFTRPDATEHPDSHILFDGYKIPMYQECVQLVLRAHELNKNIQGVGWDVALTQDGPLLVEANPNFGFDLMQATGEGYRSLLWERYLPLAQKYARYSNVLL